MKNKTFTLIAALALVGSAFFRPANAGQVPFPQDGDLFMGFHSSAATNEYLWDIGQYTQFDGKPVGFHLVLGNIQTDLTTVFGGGWATDIEVQWGSAGTLDASSKLFASKAEPAVGTFAQPWLRQSTSAQNNTGSTIDTMVFGDYAGQNATSNNPTAVIHSTTGLSWASYNNGANSNGASFSTWVPTVEAPQFLGGGKGIAATRLDLFHIDPDNTGTNPPSTYEGSFSVDSAGNVTFDVFAALPVITLTVPDRNASEGPPIDTGTMTFARTGATTSALTVLYRIAGTAKNGVDYARLKGKVVIKAGKGSVNVVITPTGDTITRNRTVIFTISASASYTIGSPNTGTVTITP